MSADLYWGDNSGSLAQQKAVQELAPLPQGVDDLPAHFDHTLYDDEFTRAVFSLDHRNVQKLNFHTYLFSVEPFTCACGKTFALCDNKGGPLGLPACLTLRGIPCATVYGVAMAMRQWCPAAICAWIVQLLSSGNSTGRELARLVTKLQDGISLDLPKRDRSRPPRRNLDVIEWLQTLSPINVGRTASSFDLYGKLLGCGISASINFAFIACACLEYGRDAWADRDPFALTKQALPALMDRICIETISGLVSSDVGCCATGAVFDALCIEENISPPSLLRLLTLDEALHYRGWTVLGYGWGMTLDYAFGGGEYDCEGHVLTWGYYGALTDILDREKDSTDTHDNIVNAYPEVDWPTVIWENFNQTECCSIHTTYIASLWWFIMSVSHVMYRPRAEVLSLLRNFDTSLCSYGRAGRKAIEEARFSGTALADIGCMQKWKCRPVLINRGPAGGLIEWCSDCYRHRMPLDGCACKDPVDLQMPAAWEIANAGLIKLLLEKRED